VTNSVAVLVGAIILGSIAVDILMFDSENLVFLGRKFLDFVEWLAFWR
jgi:hypothetical protein